MFVLDTGMVGEKRVCPAQILIFNINEDKLMQRVVIPNEYAMNSTTGKGLLVTPIVNTDCGSTWVNNNVWNDVEYSVIFIQI